MDFDAAASHGEGHCSMPGAGASTLRWTTRPSMYREVESLYDGFEEVRS
jgi:hypothetical protein